MDVIDTNGLRFAFLEEGTGPLVLLLHGFPDTPHSWDAIRPRLAAAGYRAGSPFARGYAPTSVASDGAYDADTLGRDVVALVKALGEERAIVVGHDWGAVAAYAAATTAPGVVRHLVTVGVPHARAVRPTPSLLWQMRHFFWLRMPGAAKRVAANDFAYVDELVQRWSPRWSVPAGATDAVKEVFRNAACLDAALGYYRATGLPPRSLRADVHVPTTCFAGEDDIMPMASFDRAAPRFTAGYEVVRLPGGHFMHREHPDAFGDALLGALDRHASSERPS